MTAEEHMQRLHRYLALILLGPTIFVPIVVTASPNPQDREDREERREERRERERRYYDRSHRDYHVWNDREDRAYRRWLAEKHYEARLRYDRMRRRQRAEYWEWRHRHPDDDDRR